MKCNICDKYFSDKKKIKQHRNNVHQMQRRCSLCNLLISKNKIKKHLHIQHRVFYTCHDCGKNYRQRIKYIKHRKKHKTTCLKCTMCNNVFSKYKYLIKHIYVIHQVGFICECGKKYTTSFEFEKHKNHKHGIITAYSCKICPKTFKYNKQLQEHLKKEHNKINTSTNCRLCTAKFISRSALIKHQQTKHNINFKCTMCEKNYSSKKGYLLHKKQFHKIGQKCKYCNKQFVSNTKLQTHLYKEHNILYKCNICAELSKKYKYILRHEYAHNKKSLNNKKSVVSTNKDGVVVLPKGSCVLTMSDKIFSSTLSSRYIENVTDGVGITDFNDINDNIVISNNNNHATEDINSNNDFNNKLFDIENNKIVETDVINNEIVKIGSKINVVENNEIIKIDVVENNEIIKIGSKINDVVENNEIIKIGSKINDIENNEIIKIDDVENNEIIKIGSKINDVVETDIVENINNFDVINTLKKDIDTNKLYNVLKTKKIKDVHFIEQMVSILEKIIYMEKNFSIL